MSFLTMDSEDLVLRIPARAYKAINPINRFLNPKLPVPNIGNGEGIPTTLGKTVIKRLEGASHTSANIALGGFGAIITTFTGAAVKNPTLVNLGGIITSLGIPAISIAAKRESSLDRHFQKLGGFTINLSKDLTPLTLNLPTVPLAKRAFKHISSPDGHPTPDEVRRILSDPKLRPNVIEFGD